jgi:hypothetical protein
MQYDELKGVKPLRRQEVFSKSYADFRGFEPEALAKKLRPTQSRRNTMEPAQPVNSASVAVASP